MNLTKQGRVALPVARGGSAALLLLVLCLGSGPLAAPVAAPATPAAAQAASKADTLQRHPLETRALQEPEAVLREVGAALINAQLAGDTEQVALLHLAQANACRMVADWECQREAGIRAQVAAREIRSPHLEVRGLIAESRGRVAVQDYNRGARLLAQADQLLKQHPQAELLADVMLAYSSTSYSLGKHELGIEYANRGLAVLQPGEGLTMSARLLRNRARSQAQLGQVEAATASVREATLLSQQLNDPKLEAELYLEGARIARIVGDRATQLENGRRVVAMGQRLSSTQLAGLGHEVLGLAAADAGDGATAQRELAAAQDSFGKLQLQADELRVLRERVLLLLRFDPGSAQLAPVVQRFLTLDSAISQVERSEAAGDFGARLDYAERENEVLRLQAETQLAAEREQALARTNRLNRMLLALGIAVLGVLTLFFVAKQRSNRRLQALLSKLGESELQYRTLAENSSDLVVRLALDGTRRYVSPSTHDILGIAPEDLMQSDWQLVHPDDRAPLEQALRTLAEQGGSLTVRYRAKHAKGHWVWIEALARRVQASDGSHEIVYAGRDISARVRAEQALAASQIRLRAVTDNIPALISHVDSQERYTFTNSLAHSVFETQDSSLIGRTVREVRGEEIYREIGPHIAEALAGQRVTFDGQSVVKGKHYHYQTSYVPDVGEDGVQNGFFAFTYDITQLKDAEQALEQLARFDAMTGLANRRYFDERLAATVARCRRQGAPLALLYLDIDHFKLINDGYGHTAGDEVLKIFASRLKSCVREGDLAARVGGDEFVLLLEGAATAQDAQAVANKLLALMSEPMVVLKESLQVRVSIGLAYSPQCARAEKLLAAADSALYEAKSAGRNTSRLVHVE